MSLGFEKGPDLGRRIVALFLLLFREGGAKVDSVTSPPHLLVTLVTGLEDRDGRRTKLDQGLVDLVVQVVMIGRAQ